MPARRWLRACWPAAAVTLGAAAPAWAQDNAEAAWSLIGEQIVLLATVVAMVASLPTLLEFWIDRRKRRERIALSIDDLAVAELDIRLAGYDALLADIADLIDRARNPDAYAALQVGNEILLVGPDRFGKTTLAHRIARKAGMDRIVVVYNLRSADALIQAKALIRAYRNRKVMLLLLRLDGIEETEDEELLAELTALVETSTGRKNVLVVGTAQRVAPGSAIDNLFGVVLPLPGAAVAVFEPQSHTADVAALLTAVAGFYLERARAAGFALADLTVAEAAARIAAMARSPGDVEDIVVLAQTAALHRQRAGLARDLALDQACIDRAIRRVAVSLIGV